MAKIKQTILDIAEANGYEGGEPKTIIGALDALTDTVAGDDEDGGTSINGAVKALAPYIGGGGASFGNMQAAPTVWEEAPKVGDSPLPYFMEVSKVMASPDLEDGVLCEVSFEQTTKFSYVRAGTYLLSGYISKSEIDTVDAYICTLQDNGSHSFSYDSVTPWDGQIDIIEDQSRQGYFRFGFTMPDLGGFQWAQVTYADLVLHAYKK